jgi:hypothetical protein
MPVSVEVKYEYFFTWGGRIKIIELALAALCMMCSAPAYWSTQHWFLLVVVLGFLGTLYFTIHNLALEAYVKNAPVNFTQLEFWFTAITTFLYFTAFVAQLAEFAVTADDSDEQYWFDANVAAGVFALFNDIAYAVGTYFIYLDWKSGPTVMNASGSSPMPPA